MIELWQGFGPETKAAIISAFTTVLVAIIGFGGLILQMRSQARQSRDAIAENERRKLKATMYEEAVAVSRDLSDAAIDLSTKLRMMPFHLKVAAAAYAEGRNHPLPSTRFPELNALFESFSDAALRFIFLVENRRIIDPRIVVYRTALNVVLHDTRKLMYQDFIKHVMPALPTAAPDGSLFPYTPPSDVAVKEINGLCDRFLASLDDATMCAEDFVVELQNKLLGDLFGKTVPHRQPLDPMCRVITLDKADDLEKWYSTSTEWGRHVANVEAGVRQTLRQKAE